jgi:serine kinase of HPr protein (carbohydrate metabolism regulator)
MAAPTIHASAVLVGARAVLIQGPSGSGKSRLALTLLQAAGRGAIPFARLIGDDRVHVHESHGRLLVQPAAALTGRIEVRGLGIRLVEHEPIAVVGLVVDLDANDAVRLPSENQREIVLSQVRLPRLAVATGMDPWLPLMAHLTTTAAPA